MLSGNWPQSCVEASEARAGDVAAEIQKRVKNGQLNLHGHTIKVGVRSGYQTFGASWHTYTVIEVQDPTGKSVRTIEVDTYVVPTADVDTPDDLIGPPQPIDWADPSQQAVPSHTIE